MNERVGSGQSSWVEVSIEALRNNIALFRRTLSDKTRLLAVVKANAYGHGLAEVAKVCVEDGVEMLGVHSAQEVIALRGLGVHIPILVMGYLTAEQIQAAIDTDVHVMLSSYGVLDSLAAHAQRLGKPISVHLKVDTGTHRQGVDMAEIVPLAQAARRRGLDVVGVATHFANIEDTTDHSYARAQLDRFRTAISVIEAEVGRLPFIHAACSAAALLFREADFSMARVGISLYGHWPSKETYLSWLLAHGRDGVKLESVLSWRARIGQLKIVRAASPVGYGLTYRPTRDSRIAVIPVGYAEGYPRALSNRSRVIVRGTPAPVVGRVCMNMFMVDVTDVAGVADGDVVTLIGADGKERVTAEELAEQAGTINYEILTGISCHLPRILV